MKTRVAAGEAQICSQNRSKESVFLVSHCSINSKACHKSGSSLLPSSSKRHLSPLPRHHQTIAEAQNLKDEVEQINKHHSCSKFYPELPHDFSILAVLSPIPSLMPGCRKTYTQARNQSLLQLHHRRPDRSGATRNASCRCHESTHRNLFNSVAYATPPTTSAAKPSSSLRAVIFTVTPDLAE